jgi:hypothetical protein
MSVVVRYGRGSRPLQHALVTMVGGMVHWSPLRRSTATLSITFQVAPHEVQVRRFRPDNFLLVFNSVESASQKKHRSWGSPPLPSHRGLIHSKVDTLQNRVLI